MFLRHLYIIFIMTRRIRFITMDEINALANDSDDPTPKIRRRTWLMNCVQERLVVDRSIQYLPNDYNGPIMIFDLIQPRKLLTRHSDTRGLDRNYIPIFKRCDKFGYNQNHKRTKELIGWTRYDCCYLSDYRKRQIRILVNYPIPALPLITNLIFAQLEKSKVEVLCVYKLKSNKLLLG